MEPCTLDSKIRHTSSGKGLGVQWRIENQTPMMSRHQSVLGTGRWEQVPSSKRAREIRVKEDQIKASGEKQVVGWDKYYCWTKTNALISSSKNHNWQFALSIKPATSIGRGWRKVWWRHSDILYSQKVRPRNILTRRIFAQWASICKLGTMSTS